MQTEGEAAPPGVGADRRVLIAPRGAAGMIRTVEELSGAPVEGPFDAVFPPTEHAPIMIGADLFIVTSVGNIISLDLAGQARPEASKTLNLGRTSPMIALEDGTLRVASTSGRLYGMGADGTELFDTTFSGAAQTRPAAAPGGTTYVATDTGQLLGFDSAGQEVFSQTVNAPASGPSATSDRIAVGELDGVSVFEPSGALRFRKERQARVVGTRFTNDGALLAWGEDGLLEMYDGDGQLIFSYSAGPPILADVLQLTDERGGFAVVDSMNTVHRVSLEGEQVATFALETAPLPELALGSLGLVYLAVGQEIFALNFNVEL